MTSSLVSARQLADRGMKVFPLKYHSKEPAVRGWQGAASSDTETLADWFKGRSRNIGIATGPSGLLVIDVDMKKVDGRQAWKDLIHGREIPRTLTASTPSGGYHMFFRGNAASSAGRLAPGIDVRSDGGFIVGVGSVLENGEYAWALDLPIAEAPEWLVELCGKPRPKTEIEHLDQAFIDIPANVELARKYLADAEPAIEGLSGDQVTFKTAARVLDYGLSVERAVEVMYDWNDRCSPPWGLDELTDKVENAARYRRVPIGCATPEADFEIVKAVDENPSLFSQLLPVRRFSVRGIPKRQWLWGKFALLNYVTLMVAAPGAGKSTLSLAVALAVITGRKDITGIEVHQRGAVVLINNEDDKDEVERRLAALMDHWSIPWEEIEGQLYIWTADQKAWKIARRNKAGNLVCTLKQADADEIRKNNVKLFIADPFLETHEGEENDNREINLVGQMYRQLAKQANCAVLLVHHTRKMAAQDKTSVSAGNMDAARGAGSLIGVVRVGVTLHRMTEKDAEHYGISPQDSVRYVRLDHGKGNLSARMGSSIWYETVEKIIDNSDEVGVLVRTKLVSSEVREVEAFCEAIKDEMETTGNRIMTLLDAVRASEGSPLLSDYSEASRKTRIKKYFEEPQEFDGWIFQLEEEVRGGKTRYHISASQPLEFEDEQK